MRVILFTDKKKYSFILPQQIFGSFIFDYDENADFKLINIEAKNGKWYIFSTERVKVFLNNNQALCYELNYGNFYILERDNIRYLIYVCHSLDNSFNLYNYNEHLNLIIGKRADSTLLYKNDFVEGNVLKIYYDNKTAKYLLKKTGNAYIYLNNIYLNNDNNIELKYGTVIDILSLQIIFLKDKIILNNPNNTAEINELNCGINRQAVNLDHGLLRDELKELNLYNENEFFSKSPRIRRIIETKKLIISDPPDVRETETSILYTIIPMLTMGISSIVNLSSTLIALNNGEKSFEDTWPSLTISSFMLLSTLFWPIFLQIYTKYDNKRKIKSNIKKYEKYLVEKQKEIIEETNLQKSILIENLLSNQECYNIAVNRNLGLWSRRLDQKDFLTIRIGKGDVNLDMEVTYPKVEFSVYEDVLKNKVSNMVKEYEILHDVPVGYSFLDKRITAIMGDKYKSYFFLKNIILQFVALHSYEDLKIVVFTYNDNLEYIKFLPHCFSNERNFRFYSNNKDEYRELSNYLLLEINFRKNFLNDSSVDYSKTKPYYLIITDCYMKIRNLESIKEITETDTNLGFSLICMENRLSKLPSKCDNFISLGDKISGTLTNAYENQQKTAFYDEINYNIDFNKICSSLANIPIEFEKNLNKLPNMLSFLELEEVSKIDQLNIINRWKMNDPIESLRAEVGVGENGDTMYLDIHEKAHGPHGLIAGMTGSGKSEFIITYVLSMALNYSPDYVSFILIDYKGGGLAGAFKNEITGIKLPHLAGVITNLDKSELDRTLTSINSEVVRRQTIFNIARDNLGESTIDIYKYQKYYREGKLKETVPHLIIICDEFAELKSQRPEFIDDLISIARIGRSLGIHLILATQKPSGVVNDQIWSNSKFRVCLKVQEKSDSMEMLKRPEAAELRQVGRFYLQVGYNELFVLGQSAWCGAEYFPSDKIKKNYDRSIDFITNTGHIYKSVQAASSNASTSLGEELINILKYIIEAANMSGLSTKQLWLENIPPVILVDNLVSKYSVNYKKYNVDAIIGEYDIPSEQKQKVLKFNLNTEGNILIYGLSSDDKELALNSLLYSTIKYHTPEEINYYIIDYGSESFYKYKDFPHVGDVVLVGDDEKLHNLFKMINDIIDKRKKLFSNFGGQYNSYIERSSEKLPLIGIILNNYDLFYESNSNYEEEIIKLTRDGLRFGVFFCISASNDSSIRRKIKQNFMSTIVLRLNDETNIFSIFGKTNIKPKDVLGRGLYKENDKETVYEFQTATIVQNDTSKYLLNFCKEMNDKYQSVKAKPIPVLPDIISYKSLLNNDIYINKVPIGIYKNSLNIANFDFTNYLTTFILGNSSKNIVDFSTSLLIILKQILNLQLIVVDINKELPDLSNIVKNYFTDNPDNIIKVLDNYVSHLSSSCNYKVVIYFHNFSKFKTKIDEKDITDFVKNIRDKEYISLIIADDYKKIKKFEYDSWFRNISNTSDGIWVGSGLYDQNFFKLSNIYKDMQKVISNDYGFVINDGQSKLLKFASSREHDDNE